MTKENSTKPAFVSQETGRGDGFLAATHVWESSTLPPWAAAAFRPMKDGSHAGGHETEHVEITVVTKKNDGQKGCLSDT